MSVRWLCCNVVLVVRHIVIPEPEGQRAKALGARQILGHPGAIDLERARQRADKRRQEISACL